MKPQCRKAIAHIVAAASCDSGEIAPMMRHPIRLQRFALDDTRISIARLATGLAAINQRDRPAVALQMDGCRHADHAGSENDRASHVSTRLSFGVGHRAQFQSALSGLRRRSRLPRKRDRPFCRSGRAPPPHRKPFRALGAKLRMGTKPDGQCNPQSRETESAA